MSPNPALLTWPRPAVGGVLAADTFSRSDNASSLGTAETGGAWATTGTWGILSGQARCYSSDTIASLDIGMSAGFTVAVTIAGSSWPGLVFRYVDTSNYYWVERDADRGYLSLYRLIAGSRDRLAEKSDGSGPQRLHISVTEGSGTQVSFWLDSDTTPVSCTDTNPSRPAGTRVGLYGQSSSSCQFDNFISEEL